MIKRILMRFVVCATSISLLLTSAGMANAAMVDTQTAISSEQRTSQVTAVNDFLAQDYVKKQLIAFGVEPAAAQQRVSMLTDSELQTLHRTFEKMPVGAGVIEVIGIVFVVLLILELLGVTNVFTRV